MILIKELKNGRKVIFDSGRFDPWCVYIVAGNGRKEAPQDIHYFTELQAIARKYPYRKVYDDFLDIYTPTDKYISPCVLHLIDSITATYADEDQLRIEQWFSVVYAGMIAEENKMNAILKKRIKHLGIYQILILNYTAEQAAGFSRGKKWQELDTLMKSYHI